MEMESNDFSLGLDLDLELEREINKMDNKDVNLVLSCIYDLAGEDIHWASEAIERDGINLFNTKFLDCLSSNYEDSDLGQSLAILYAAEGKNINKLDLIGVIGFGEDGDKEKMVVDQQEEATCSGESSQYDEKWPSTTTWSESEEEYTKRALDEEKRYKALKKRRDVHRKAGRSTLWKIGDKLDRKQISFIKTEEKVNKEEEEEEMVDGEFMVEDIIARRWSEKDRGESYVPTCPEDNYEYLIKWEGFGPEDNTWEPYDGIKHCTEELERLSKREEKRNQSKQQPLKKTTRAASGQRKTTRNCIGSGELQVNDDNNNNLVILFDSNEEQHQERKRKRVKREESDDDDDVLWLPQPKKRKTDRSPIRSQTSKRTLPRRLASTTSRKLN